ncbi:MAG TPA: N-acetyl-gamma-glutamyl-phosphate reductase [Vicinamibacterales bacterium]|jgi:N-acetyl-gamma-glutamyl-phosphate reductase|nr:N-acetyl-gamma-glutamyl-phosphate reductase [Vicinamibacterales bacterium]
MNTYADSVRVGVAGATGYSGVELLRLLSRHPRTRVTAAMGSPGSEARRVRALTRVWDEPIEPLDVEWLADNCDAVFLALPEQASAAVAPDLLARGTRVFDLSGAFRLKDRETRRQWYPHTPDAGITAVYGLTEKYRDGLASSQFVACAGCYPTAAILSLQPLIELIEQPIIIDAKSGVSGAGKTPTERTHFSECHGSLSAYGVFSHRHAAEIEQELGVPVTFVPHLLPIDRGILETIYATLRPGATEEDVAEAYRGAYAHSPFVRLTGPELPEIKHVAHTNFCDIGWRLQPARRQLVVVACIDNLVKGAAGQAVQNFNIAFGFDEATGLN